MYIEPQTNIRLLKDVPLDTSYDHTIYFSTAVAQANYFLSKQKYNLINYTYQRVNKGVARVGIKADNLYDCNYMMFQNTAYGNKWFYAFITAVEYVNDVTANVSFEIDDMQTWHFDYTVDHCFVEREHVTDDTIGAHIEPENLECGEYVYNTHNYVTDLSNYHVVVAVVEATAGEHSTAVQGNVYEKIYSGATLYAFPSTNVEDIDAFLSGYVQKPDSILAMYMIPSCLLTGITLGDETIKKYEDGELVDDIVACVIPNIPESNTTYITDNALVGAETLDGYTPKNKKLYTYPYNFFNMDNGNGSNLQLRYEFFEGLLPRFAIIGTLTQPVSVIARPQRYKNIRTAPSVQGNNPPRYLPTEALTLATYPLCSWNVDAYQAWVAQNAIPMVYDVAGSAITGVAGSAISGNPLAGLGIVGTVMNKLSERYTASIKADISGGNFSNGNVNIPKGMNNVFYSRMSITHQYAKMIDDYFNMFGYGVKVCKVPNRNARPHWNYVKTVGCTLTGSVPADSMRHLCQIYDHGITFWNNGDEVGNYSLNNAIT